MVSKNEHVISLVAIPVTMPGMFSFHDDTRYVSFSSRVRVGREYYLVRVEVSMREILKVAEASVCSLLTESLTCSGSSFPRT